MDKKPKPTKKIVKGKKECKDCGAPTTDYYPIPKTEDDVRCSDCQERWVRHSSMNEGIRVDY